MAISLTTDGLSLDYRDTIQSSVSGTYPIGTAIVVSTDSSNSLKFPGTWTYTQVQTGTLIGSTFSEPGIGIRIK